MIAHSQKAEDIAKSLKSSVKNGLTSEQAKENLKKYGQNVLSEKKPKTLFKRLIDALLEPMMLILGIAFIITLGVNIGKVAKGGEGDFYECLGIFIAILISTALTIIMESKSEKAFKLLKSLSDTKSVKLIRDGKTTFLPKAELAVGDLVLLEAGDKIPADGRIVTCADFKVDESTLTGESKSVEKNGRLVLGENAPLAERVNMVYGGTYVESGSCFYVVTAVGSLGEIGKIADEVGSEKSISAPLEEKLTRLGKMVSIFGGVASILVFVLSLVRLILLNDVSFDSVQDIFIESIVLIVAAVPEGLPTTVAISLTLNVVRLAKSNALIRKLVATETVGCVSVICSDKTGTLTQNKMSLVKLWISGVSAERDFFKGIENNKTLKMIAQNCAVNSTAELSEKIGRKSQGSATEIALLKGLFECGIDYQKIRKSGAISSQTPFSSKIKYMETTAQIQGERLSFLKGAPEVVIQKCILKESESAAFLSAVENEQKTGGRVLAFAHSKNSGAYVLDGFAVINDSLRDDVYESILKCKEAGVKVKILTGDNPITARYIANQAGLDGSLDKVVTADYVESLDKEKLKEVLENVTVIARSTPTTKLLVVTALQEMGEVVAVTGDGVNDAPAIRHADIGISMGDGSEITKEASDIVLLDNSFSTILTAISFGRNVYANFQRFIMFQLTVNLASMCIIIASLIMGLESPFSSTCLLWLNVIMDGPLALSLGLEMRKTEYLSQKPVKRQDNILSLKILARIVLHSVYMCLIVSLQRLFNFLGAEVDEQNTVVISMFVFFQVFNAINCREVSSQSAFKGLTNNKLLLAMTCLTYFLHIIITTFAPSFFKTVPLSFSLWLKITLVCFSAVILSECYKWGYRSIICKKRTRKANKTAKKEARPAFVKISSN